MGVGGTTRRRKSCIVFFVLGVPVYVRRGGLRQMSVRVRASEREREREREFYSQESLEGCRGADVSGDVD